MSTVRDLITDALRNIGAIAAGEAVEAVELQAALRTLNQMFSAWNQREVLVYTVQRTLFPLTNGKQDYTLGIGGDFDIPRPAQIQMASILVNQGNAQPLEIPLHIYTDEEWRDVPIKHLSSTWPTAVYPNNNMPLNGLAFWPYPTSPCTFVLYHWQRTLAFASVNDEVVFPDGYEEAIVSNLAIRLSPQYDREPRPALVQMARISLDNVASSNWEPATINPAFPMGIRSTPGLLFNRSKGYVMP